jgi:transposase
MKPKQKGPRIKLTRSVSISAIKKEIRTTTDEAYKTRLRAILSFYKGNSQKHIEETMILSRRALHNWIVLYNASGMESLKTNVGGRPKGKTKWDNAPFERLAKEINSHDQYWSIALMMKWLEEHEKITVPQTTVWYRMIQLGYSNKSSRPFPYKGDPEKQEAFKKGVYSRH